MLPVSAAARAPPDDAAEPEPESETAATPSRRLAAGATLAGTFALALDTRPTGGTLQYTGAIPASAAACCGRTSVLAMVEALQNVGLGMVTKVKREDVSVDGRAGFQWQIQFNETLADLPQLQVLDASGLTLGSTVAVATETEGNAISGTFRLTFGGDTTALIAADATAGEVEDALEQAEELGVTLRDAATRVFSNAAGSYSANVGLAIENGGWEDESQLQEQFLSRKGFAFNADRPGILDDKADMFKSSLKKVDVTFQNLDSSEISLTDVSHYFDSDPTKVVGSLRTDGKKPSSFVADTTTANGQVRTLSETVRLDARTKLLNPKFYEGMLKSGYEGTREITKRLRNTMGWSATAGAVDNFVYEDANDVFIADEEMQKRLLETNPNAFRDMVTTFLEANGRGYWETSEENLDRLSRDGAFLREEKVLAQLLRDQSGAAGAMVPFARSAPVPTGPATDAVDARARCRPAPLAAVS